jgi:DNA-directed RNA polymerase II subunit RPB1
MKRKIKEEEINYLFSEFDDYFPKYLDNEMRNIILSNLKNTLIHEFKQYKIYKETLPELKSQLKKYVEQAVVPSGEMVGVICAQSIGERQTQLTLNSFHSAGLNVSMVTTGVPRFLEILNATKEPKICSNSFEMKDKKLETITDIRKTIGNSLKHLCWKDLIEIETLYLEKEDEAWFESFEFFYSNEFRIHKTAFSYKMKKDVLFRNNISFPQIREVFENEFDFVHVVFSPYHIGQIDLFIDMDEIQKQEEKNEEMNNKKDFLFQLFLQEVIRQKILDMPICGISKIKDFFIQREDVSKKFVVNTEGTNMVELLKLPYIDIKTLKTNHMWDVFNIIGIEGTRKFLLEELTNIVSSDGTFINQCHLTLLIDLMTFNGTIQSISRYGVKKEQNSVLTRSSFEESLEHFSKAAFFCEKENIKSVSASIMCGKRSNIGTGSLTLNVDWEKFN